MCARSESLISSSKANMTHFSDRLLKAIEAKGAPICVGLDPRLDQLPVQVVQQAFHEYGKNCEGVAAAFEIFNRAVIDVIYDLVPVVKPQMAFYEAYGSPGIQAFKNTVDYARSKGLIVIEDAKRNDIGSTATAYASGHLGYVSTGSANPSPSLDVDALTINAYLGYDGIKPFIQEAMLYGKGVFILVKTSNPSSKDIQDLILAQPFKSIPLYERVAQLVDEWGRESIGTLGFSDVGAVVGATFPLEIAKLRQIMPRTMFLLPGYGSQGARGKDVVSAFNARKEGAIVSSSRDIIYAFRSKEGKEIKKEGNFTQLIRQSVLLMREDINTAFSDRKDNTN